VTIDGQEWEVAAPPQVHLQGKRHTVQLRREGDQTPLVKDWAARERVRCAEALMTQNATGQEIQIIGAASAGRRTRESCEDS
jgi:hypothetical protein